MSPNHKLIGSRVGSLRAAAAHGNDGGERKREHPANNRAHTAFVTGGNAENADKQKCGSQHRGHEENDVSESSIHISRISGEA